MLDLKDRSSQSAVFADLQELAADLVELPADFINQVQSARSQQNRPFGSLAIELQQADTSLAIVRHGVYDLIESKFCDRHASSPDDRAVSRIDDALHACV